MFKSNPNPTQSKFLNSESKIKAIIGPIACGKTTACLMELKNNIWKAPLLSGVRYSRWLVLAQSYDILNLTVIPSVKQFFGEICKDTTHGAKIDNVNDSGEIIRADVIVDVFKNIFDHTWLAYSGAWIYDFVACPQNCFSIAVARSFRVPLRHHEYGVVVMDGPITSEEHWIYNTPGIELFHCPPAIVKDRSGKYVVNPSTENVHNLPQGYYETMVKNAENL